MKKTLQNASVLGILALTSSCGDSPSSPNDAGSSAPSAETNNATEIQNASPRRFTLGPITEETITGVAQSVVRAIRERHSNPYNGDDVYIAEPAPELTNGKVSTTTPCTKGGEVNYIFVTSSPMGDKTDHSVQVFSAGDYFITTYASCVGLFSEPGEPGEDTVYSGTTRTDVLEGKTDIFDNAYSPTLKTRKTWGNQTIYFPPLPAPNYVDGDMTTMSTPDKSTIAGKAFLFRVAIGNASGSDVLEQPECMLKNYSFTETPTGTYDKIFQITGKGEIGCSYTDSSFNLTITTPLRSGAIKLPRHSHKIFTSGKVEVSGSTGKGEIAFFPTYFSYRIDVDGDGDFESSGDKFWSQILR